MKLFLKSIGVIILLPIVLIIGLQIYHFLISLYPYSAYGAIPVDRIARRAIATGEPDPCRKIIAPPLYALMHSEQSLKNDCYYLMAKYQNETEASVAWGRISHEGAVMNYETFDPNSKGKNATGYLAFIDFKTGVEIGGMEVPLIVSDASLNIKQMKKDGKRVVVPSGQYVLQLRASPTGPTLAEGPLPAGLNGTR